MGTGPLQMHVLLQRAAARTMIWRNSSRGPPRCSPPTLLSRRSLPVVAAQLFGADGNNLLILLCFLVQRVSQPVFRTESPWLPSPGNHASLFLGIRAFLGRKHFRRSLTRGRDGKP